MMKRRTFLQACVGAALTSGLGRAVWAASPDALFTRQFPDHEGIETPLGQWLGRPVVFNFWATWCPPCIKEMPDLEALSQQFPGVQFVGLGVDTAANVRKFMPKVNVSYPLLVTGYAGIDLMKSLGNAAGGLPFTLVYDAAGQVVERILGQIKPAELEAVLQRFPVA